MYRSALLRLAVGLAIGIHALTLSAASVWFGDKDGLHRIDTATNQIASSIPFEPTVAIAVSPADGSLWAISQERLARLSEHGAVQFEIAVRDLGTGLGAPRRLVLNPNDGSVWAGFENRILHLDAAGVLRHALPVAAHDLAIGQDGSVWILAQSALQQHDSTGALLRSVALNGAQRFKHLALDDAGGVLWLAGEKDLVQWSLSAPGQASHSMLAPETISGISVDMQTGDLWALGQNGLFAYGRDGMPRVSRDLRDFTIANPQEILFDFSSQAVWVGHQQGLTRITVAGTVAAAFPAAPHVLTIAIGRTPVEITPIVSIVAPQNGALLNTATPELRVDYDARCSTTPCGFPNSFFSTFTLSALLNGTETGSSFVFDPTTGGASFTPAARLPEGLNTFSARARDSFGRFSETVSASFTVDTIPPAFVNVTPASGSIFSNPSLSIAGSVDDATATVTLGEQSQGQHFSFPVTLNEGANTFTLIARDPAGNTASLPLTYTYEKPVDPPNALPVVQLTVAAGDPPIFAPATLQLTATATDSDGAVVKVEFLRNGVVEATLTAAPYVATLTNVAAGTYSLVARATDDDGGVTTSAPVSITVVTPSITIDTPLPGTAINGNNVIVRGRFVAPRGSGVRVNDFTAAVDAAGNYAVLVPLNAGANTLTATLATLDGATATQSVSVTASGGLSPFGVEVTAMSGYAPLTTTFTMHNPNNVNATFTFDGFGPFFLPARSKSQLNVTYDVGVHTPAIVFRVGTSAFTHRLVIESMDKAQTDQMLQAMWNGMNAALAAGNKELALSYLSEGAKEKYGPLFDALMPHMPAIVASYSPLVQVSLSAEIGEYAVTRMDGGTKRLYLIYFVRDVTGVWRIDGM